MADHFLTCPFCGFEFERLDTLCQHGCPMRTSCNLTRCPSCEFEFPEVPRPVSWLKRLLRRSPQRPIDLCDQFASVGELAHGQSARVVSLAGGTARSNALAVFGLVPGSELTLIQHQPACVVRIGETELALDSEVARQILVERPLPGRPEEADQGP